MTTVSEIYHNYTTYVVYHPRQYKIGLFYNSNNMNYLTLFDSDMNCTAQCTPGNGKEFADEHHLIVLDDGFMLEWSPTNGSVQQQYQYIATQVAVTVSRHTCRSHVVGDFVRIQIEDEEYYALILNIDESDIMHSVIMAPVSANSACCGVGTIVRSKLTAGKAINLPMSFKFVPTSTFTKD